ncbi:MAG: FAD-binding oxidoreductase [Deltaproteobacteria bacterium]|nr:FAD-binding oxidoreductase [Deltaproteobacteria bacterium]
MRSSSKKADVLICGAGIAGIAAAYHLSVKHGIKNVLLVDELPPLSLTSDKSTECYRNWWPGPGDAMVSLMNRSIDLIEDLARESGNRFHLNRRGYLFATADPARITTFKRAAEETAELGAGPVRYHKGRSEDSVYVPAPAQGFEGQPRGSDLITAPSLITRYFPYLSEHTLALLHPRRCGWFSAQQLGMYLLERARECGVRLWQARVEGVEIAGGRVEAVHLNDGGAPVKIWTGNFVNAAGPFLPHVGKMIGVDLPVFHELHVKVAFRDALRVVPRDAPLLIWTDPTLLPWSEQERLALAGSEETRYLLGEFPSGVHARPEGGEDSDVVLMLWTYDTKPVKPVFPLTFDPHYPEIVLRGLAVMIPNLRAYFGRMPKPVVDGGYYAKSRENRPLIGPLPVDGAYVIGAFSGFGLMAACASGELLAAHLTGADLPQYAPAFTLERYADPEYQKLLERLSETGQL